MSHKILMVCLGNICRSPLAEVVLKKQLEVKGLLKQTLIKSAGVGDYHIGASADTRCEYVALKNNYTSIREHKAQQVNAEDLIKFDWLLAMDLANLKALHRLATNEQQKAKCQLFLPFCNAKIWVHNAEVKDPYWDDEGFDDCLKLMESANKQLIQKLW